jgi:hypothetical protein
MTVSQTREWTFCLGKEEEFDEREQLLRDIQAAQDDAERRRAQRRDRASQQESRGAIVRNMAVNSVRNSNSLLHAARATSATSTIQVLISPSQISTAASANTVTATPSLSGASPSNISQDNDANTDPSNVSKTNANTLFCSSSLFITRIFKMSPFARCKQLWWLFSL